jgi:hypothetical protein
MAVDDINANPNVLPNVHVNYIRKNSFEPSETPVELGYYPGNAMGYAANAAYELAVESDEQSTCFFGCWV